MTNEPGSPDSTGHTGKHCATCGEWAVTDRWECSTCDSPYRRHPGA